MDGFLQGTLPLTCLPHLDLALGVPLHRYLGTRLGPGSQLLQGARPAGMKMGTSFKEKQVTVTILAVVQCLPSRPRFSTLYWAMPTSLPAPGAEVGKPVNSGVIFLGATHRSPRGSVLGGSRAPTREEQKAPGDQPPRGPQVLLVPVARQPCTSRDLTGLAFLPAEDIPGMEVLGPEPHLSSSLNHEAG